MKVGDWVTVLKGRNGSPLKAGDQGVVTQMRNLVRVNFSERGDFWLDRRRLEVTHESRIR